MNERSSIPAPPKFNASLTDNDNVPSIPTANDTPGTSAVNSDKQRTSAPPPPKFSAPPPPALQHHSRPATDPAKAAVLAAAKAAQHATPAQRERMVMEAAAQALAQRTATAENNDNTETENNATTTTTTAPAAAPLGPYQPPFWASHPPTMPFSIEIMKQGTIISTVNLQQLCIDASKGYLTLGRAPTNDILLDHPSSSRLHAVLEFRSSEQKDGEQSSTSDLNSLFLFDPGSTHGCYVNKARIAAGQRIPLHVGDMLRFGESSRITILCGPAELMVEEGPSREQRKQAAALEALSRRKEKDAAAAKLAMANAIAAGGGGVNWGFAEDARGDSDEENGDGRVGSKEVDWREHASNKGLTEKQQKFADKIRKREARIMNLQKESEKIQSKQRSMEEMSVGQASTLARNEEEVEKAMIEIEELEDQLVASIEDSLSGKNKSAGDGGKKISKGEGKKRRRRGGRGGSDEESEYQGDNSDEDSFYDRTRKRAAGGRKTRTGKTRSASGGGGGGGGGGEVFEDAASLYGALEALKEEKLRIEALVAAETAQNVMFIASEQQKHFLDATGVTAHPPITSAASGGGNQGTAAVDSLDDFMAGVESTIESDRAASLRKELTQIESKIKTTTHLLKIADPDNFYKPGSKAAELAVQRAQKAVRIEQERKKAEQRQKQETLAAKVAKETIFVEEEEDDDDDDKEKIEIGGLEREKQQTNIHQVAGEVEGQGVPAFGLQLQTKKATRDTPRSPVAATNASMAVSGDIAIGGERSAYEKRRAGIAASLQALKSSAAQSQIEAAQETDEATAKVLADLAVLQQAKRGSVSAASEAAEGEKEGKKDLGSAEVGKGDDATWLPPDNQKGDGRTSLNDKFGY